MNEAFMMKTKIQNMVITRHTFCILELLQTYSEMEMKKNTTCSMNTVSILVKCKW